MTPTDAPPDAATPTIEAIAARLAAITPPPWLLLPPLCGPDGQGVYNEDGGCICEVGDPYPRGDNHPQENMTFIAHAPADIAALLTLVTAADAFVAAYTAYHEPWVLESSREGLTAERAMADAVAAYQAARGRQAREEGS